MRADALVLFGGTGDLARKKLFPALYEMEEAGELELPVIAVASSRWTQVEFRANAEKAIRDRIQDINEDILKRLLDELHLVVGDYRSPQTFALLRDKLADFKLPVIYLAISPDMFEAVTQGLCRAVM